MPPEAAARHTGSMGTSERTETGQDDVGPREQGWLIVRRVARGFFRTASADAAAGLTFYAVLALFPALIAAFSLIGLVGEKREGVTAVLDIARDVLAPDVLEAVSDPIEEVASTAGGFWVLLTALALALWSVARYVTGLGRAMNRIYGVPEGRVLWKAKPAHLLLTGAVFVLVTIACLLAAVSRPIAESLGRALGAGEVALTIWRVGRWPVLVLVVALVIALLYYYAPNVRHSHFRLVSVGAVAALLVFAVASLGFGLYAANLADYGRIYGSFGGIVVFLIWLWIGNGALLLGALLDAELERVYQLRKGIPAERELDVEVRDTERLERNAENDLQDERAARRLRRSRR